MDYRFTTNIRTDNKQYIIDALKLLIDYIRLTEDTPKEDNFEISIYGNPGEIIGKAILKDGIK